MYSKTCFHNQNIKYGAKMTQMFGYDLPWEFAAGGEAEHMAVREKAGMVDLGYMAKFHITGVNSLRFLQMLLTTDVGTLKNGQIKYAAMCNENGLMIDDCTIWKYKDDEYVLVTGDESDKSWIMDQSRGFGLNIINDTFSTGALQVQGPFAHDIMRDFTGLDPKSIGYYNFRELTIYGHYVVAAKMNFTGSGGFEFHVAYKDAEWLFEKLLDIGMEYGMMLFGQRALESLRQEGGFLLVGQDHDKTANPLEVGIGQVVKFEKDTFNGKAALEKIAKKGVKTRLVWLNITDGTEPRSGDKVILCGKQVGVVTSGSYSPASGKGVAMARVQVGNVFPGLTYRVFTDDIGHDASLSPVPLYDPAHEIRRL